MIASDMIVDFHREIAFDFRQGTLVLPHALPSYQSSAEQGAGGQLQWDDIDDRRSIEDYSVSEVRDSLAALYAGQRDQYLQSDFLAGTDVVLRQARSRLIPQQGGSLRPQISYVQGQFGTLLVPASDDRMRLGGVMMLCDAPTLALVTGLNPLLQNMDELLCRVFELAYGSQTHIATLADAEKLVFSVSAADAEKPTPGLEQMRVKARQVNGTFLRADATGRGPLAVTAVSGLPSKSTWLNLIYEWEFALPEPLRDEEGRVRPRVPFPRSPFWHWLEQSSRRIDLLMQEDRLCHTGICDIQ